VRGAGDESQSFQDDGLGFATGDSAEERRDSRRRLWGRGDREQTRDLAPEGKVVGLDYSAASVAVSRDTNADEIAAGRVHIERGSVAALPFPDCTFDVVTAVETHYYWPDLPANVREIRRVLKPGGMFTLIADTYRGGPFRLVYGIVMPVLRADLLTQAGFTRSGDQPRLRKKSDLRHGVQADIAVPVPTRPETIIKNAPLSNS